MSETDWYLKATSTSASITSDYYNDYVKKSYVEELEKAKKDLVYFAKKYIPKELNYQQEYLLQPVEDMEVMRNARDNIHKQVKEMEEKIFEVRGSISIGEPCDISSVKIDDVEEETPEVDLQYFDPKDLDI